MKQIGCGFWGKQDFMQNETPVDVEQRSHDPAGLIAPLLYSLS